jgi:hypothetical protein
MLRAAPGAEEERPDSCAQCAEQVGIVVIADVDRFSYIDPELAYCDHEDSRIRLFHADL